MMTPQLQPQPQRKGLRATRKRATEYVLSIESRRSDAPKSARTSRRRTTTRTSGKHVSGHNNYQPGKSELTDPNPQALFDEGAGMGQQLGTRPVGQPGSKERVDFGKIIGDYVDPVTRERVPTSVGVIHYGSRGAHIAPARPR
jgi:hypothetical protein